MTLKIRASMFRAPDAFDPPIRELLEMHTFMRPAGGKTETAFCARYLDCLPGVEIDRAGNRILRIGTAPVLWSSHTDTVHKTGGIQRVTYGDGILSLSPKQPASNCLGADDSAGVWIMRQMALRQIPGLYIWHAAEEIGGIGSDHIVRETPEILAGIDYAIALDRKGTSSVITHQGSRCASDTFADALADHLGGMYGQDDTGTFTDTAHYTYHIAECTNLSVGYYGAHSSAEILDVSFVAHLLERLCTLDVSSLPVMRDPADEAGLWSEDPWQHGGATRDLRDLCWDHPDVAADILEEWGLVPEDFERHLAKQLRGTRH